MLIDFRTLFPKYNIKPKGVLHIGANVGEEAPVYLELGITKQIWVEANPETFSILKQKVLALPGQFDNDKLFFCNYCIGDVDGQEVTFHVSNNGSQSSSILELGIHKQQHPDVHYVRDYQMKTTRIDTIIDRLKNSVNQRGYNSFNIEDFDFLNIDLQGAELMALRGMGDYLRNFKWAYLEVNRAEVYVNCAQIDSIDLFMIANGFRRVETKWIQNWGDALYIK